MKQPQKRTKILFIHHGTGIGGASLSLLYLASGLDKELFDVSVLFMQASEAVDLFKQSNLNVVGPINRSDFSHTKIWWYRWYHVHHLLRAIKDSLLLYAFEAERWLKKLQPDIIHLNTSSLFAWAKVAKKLNIPVIWHIREPLAPGYLGIRRSAIKWLIKNWATKIIPICIDNARPWKDNPKTQIVYNAVPEDKFSSVKPILPKKPKILFLGGISQEKGTLLLLKSFKLLLKQCPKAELLIAGSWRPKYGIWKTKVPITKWHHYCHKIDTELKTLKDKVKILGIRYDIPELIASCSLLVFPATQGHFARPIIEAGFMGKPAVATNLPPLQELILDKQTGLLALPDNPEDLALKMLKIINDNKLAKQLGENAKKWCRTKFGLKYQLTVMTEIFLEKLQTRKRVT